MIKVVDWGGTVTQCGILCGLEAVDMGVCCARFPGEMCVSEEGCDILFVYLSDVFFGVTERCYCRSSEEVQTCFCFRLCVLYELSERHSSVKGHSKCGGVVGVWGRLTVQRNRRL